ncbi:Trypsin-like peptidase domain-containing protein [Butyrivibrio fibrisolvens DSM 3071]|uniref:Trypsin-like peptidase domain-containing protein n=1 Tax=Butyrivibrio fibrisolvens DSM 3071 TaxID=1121131 RepID=A0A1M5YJ26_BUTFI|nr:Trypsin-like peptidase domain-containing protein [Butyrivibrio fibrisolvens DSM 3071]
MFVAIVALQFNTVKEFLGIADHGTSMTILEEPDCGIAYENAKQTMVQIHIYTDIAGVLDDSGISDDKNGTTTQESVNDQESDGMSDNQVVNPAITNPEIYGSFGSGSIWEYNEDSILVVTNYHVISPVVTKNALGYAVFYNGVISEFTVAAFDDDADCAFLLIDSSCMTSDQLKDLRCVVPYDYENTTLTVEEPMFVVHSQEISREDMVSYITLNMIADTSYVGYIMDPSVYVSALLQDMLYCKCSADAGMSGGPTFDAYGHYIGMLTGATDSGETVSVLLSDIETVYEQIK